MVHFEFQSDDRCLMTKVSFGPKVAATAQGGERKFAADAIASVCPAKSRHLKEDLATYARLTLIVFSPGVALQEWPLMLCL
jgi:hypothetical protein